MQSLLLSVMTAFILFSNSTLAQNREPAAEVVDQELLQSLKLQANHDLVRLKSLKGEKSNQKVFDSQREKGLGNFLEEQEKWDLLRERGAAEYRKQKKQISPQDFGPEHQADIKEKQRRAESMERSRQIQVRTRNKVFSENKELISKLESEELGLNQNRPRYDLRKRGQNRWVKNASPSSKAGSSPNYSAPPPPVFDDFPPPAVEYQPIPQPMEGFEEIPPPPPPVFESYGSPGGFDTGFGEVPPPPPPPPPDYDF